MKKLILLVTAVFIISCGASNNANFDLIIFHTNDSHGRGISTGNNVINYALLAGYVENYRAEGATLLLDAGDAIAGLPTGNLARGTNVIEVMNLVGFDAMTLGNHEFNWGADHALSLIGLADFPLVAANILAPNGTPPFTPYIIRTFEGVRVAIVGLATPETLFKTNPEGIIGYSFVDPVETMRALMPALNREADIIVALAHLGQEGADTSIRLATEVNGINLIIDGHDHALLPEGLWVGNTLIVSTGAHLSNLGKVTLTIENGQLASSRAELLPRSAFESVPANAAIEAMFARINAETAVIMNEIVASTPIALNGERADVRTGETLLGQLIADSLIAETGADIAIMNGGGIRESIPAGPISKGQVITVLPFANDIVTIRINGATLRRALEHSAGVYPEQSGGFLHPGGFSYTITPSQPAGSRISNVMVNGVALNDNFTYTVALANFLASGGDGFTMFADTPLTGMFASDEVIFINYLQSGNAGFTFSPRITWVR